MWRDGWRGCSLVGLCDESLTVEQIESWSDGTAGLHARFGRRFGRSEPRDRALDYMTGLLAPLGKKNGWTLAEQVGQLRPDGVQRLLNHSEWDENAVRDDVRDFVVETIGAKDGVLIGDDTGFLKKGVSRGPAAVFRHRRPHRELPDRHVPRLRIRQGAGAGQPGTLRPEVLDG